MKYLKETEKLSVNYGKKVIQFQYLFNEKLKRTYIEVDNNEGVVIKSPISNVEEIKSLIYKKSSWIINKLDIVENSTENIKKNYVTGSRIPYLGKKYYLELLIDKSIRVPIINFSYSKFKITINPYMKNKNQNIEEYLNEFYRLKAKKKIIPLVNKLSKYMNLYPKEVKFRKATKRWGSCSKDNIINFNIEMIKLPIRYIEYIIVHELAHIKEKNHSKKFWNIVSKYCSEYKIIRKELDELQL